MGHWALWGVFGKVWAGGLVRIGGLFLVKVLGGVFSGKSVSSHGLETHKFFVAP